jgi:hypothetical protein
VLRGLIPCFLLSTNDHSPQEVRECFEFAFSNIKPTDPAIVGMYPRYSDQVAEDTRIARQLLA